MNLNKNFKRLSKNYLFAEVVNRVFAFKKKYPEKKVLNLGVGDVTLPLCDAAIKNMKIAVENLSKKETFKGYGPEEGYEFLKEDIKSYYLDKNVVLRMDEIFINDGINADVGNLLELFDNANPVLIPDPVYPAYADANIIHGGNIKYIDALKSNNFLPGPPEEKISSQIIYLCSPNNPTGAVYSFDALKQWVDYALETDSIIMFDAAYEAFISNKTLPSSIFEIPGAKRCAIELCSFSKMAGFTGVRCGYTVICEELEYEKTNVNEMWRRRVAARFNGVSYIAQMGASGALTEEGQIQTRKSLDYYKKNAEILSFALRSKNIFYTGAKNSPYVWFECPGGMKSWDFFDYFLNNFGIVGTPGVGFGKNGEYFFRLSSFGDIETTELAAEKILNL